MAGRAWMAGRAQLLRGAVGSSLPTALRLTKNRTSTRSFTQKTGHYPGFSTQVLSNESEIEEK
jgi:hypothetical protein